MLNLELRSALLICSFACSHVVTAKGRRGLVGAVTYSELVRILVSCGFPPLQKERLSVSACVGRVDRRMRGMQPVPFESWEGEKPLLPLR